MYKRSGGLQGFTIIELLVVIVVIAILAAITITSYSGVQQRALNANITSTAHTYYDALLSYSTLYGTYPPVPSQATTSADDRICLGKGYKDHTSDGIADCGNSSYPSLEYAPFNTALEALITIPQANDYVLSTPYQSSTFVGVTLIRQDSFTVNGTSNPYYMMYVLKGGNQTCSLPVLEEVSSADPFPHMKNSSSGYSWSDGNTTMCVVAMPNL